MDIRCTGRRLVLPVKIVEERKQIDSQLDPALSLASRQNVCIHDARRIVQSRTRHHRSVNVPRRGNVDNPFKTCLDSVAYYYLSLDTVHSRLPLSQSS